MTNISNATGPFVSIANPIKSAAPADRNALRSVLSK
jgi:hypothetical protein